MQQKSHHTVLPAELCELMAARMFKKLVFICKVYSFTAIQTLPAFIFGKGNCYFTALNDNTSLVTLSKYVSSQIYFDALEYEINTNNEVT